MGRPADREDGCGDAKVRLYCHNPKTEFEHATSNCDGDRSFLTRVGGSYEIEFSGWSLSPEVNVDFVDDDTVLVFGASFVWKF